MTKELNFMNFPKILYDFEEAYFDDIKDLNILGFSAWQIVKIPLFYKLLYSTEVNNNGIRSNYQSILIRLLNKFIIVVSGVFIIIKLLLSSKRKYCFITSFGDKISKDRDGLFFNSLMHPLIDLDKKNSIVLEFENKLKEPSYNPNFIGIKNFIALLSICIKPINKFNYEANEIKTKFNEYLISKGFKTQIELSLIEKIFKNFSIERSIWKLVFKLLKPEKIVSSERIGSGIMAAAQEVKIEFYEFQHGAIDEYYPPYVWSKKFSQCSNMMHPFLVVFGQFAKEIIISKSYVKPSAVLIAGYKKMEDSRALIKKTANPEGLNIFFATQTLMHEFNISSLKIIAAVNLPNIKIYFKAHPLQSSKEIDEYKSIVLNSSIQFVEPTTSVYECISNASLVISHTSTVLEEAVSLNKPAITIISSELPLGIHSTTGNNTLMNAIRPVKQEDLAICIQQFVNDISYREAWQKDVDMVSSFIYSGNYLTNIKSILN
jgi:hypothetical protein